MEERVVLWIVALETLLAGGIYLLLPRITRRGLLFGVYVGEQAADSEPARRITGTWTRALALLTVLSIVVGIAGGTALGNPLVSILSLTGLLFGSFAFYLWAYSAARRLAPASPPPPAAVAVLEDDVPSGTLPHVTLAFALACGLLGFAYAASAYPSLPERIPTHFGFSGAPDGWSAKSFGSVLLLPLMGVLQGFGLGLMCIFVAQAKRAVRLGDAGVSLAAQHAFRRAMTRFLCAITVLVSLLMLLLTVFAVRTGLGLSRGIPWLVLGLGGLLLVVAFSGAIFVAVRYGQGGARLERAGGAAAAPLTNGLADNRHWVLGMFYVNRDDPSVLVEHRFGFGYTINFGNWKAVTVLGAFVFLTLGLTLFALLSME